MSTINTAASNVYSIMSESGSSMKNIDSNKALSIGPELQQRVQETKQELDKNSTEDFRNSLHKINILV